MSGVPLETCWAFSKLWNNKFYYKAASCWYFYWIICIIQQNDILKEMYSSILQMLNSIKIRHPGSETSHCGWNTKGQLSLPRYALPLCNRWKQCIILTTNCSVIVNSLQIYKVLRKQIAAYVSVQEEGKRMKREASLQLAPVRKIPMNLNCDIKATWRQ
jgi:hypothetical protein